MAAVPTESPPMGWAAPDRKGLGMHGGLPVIGFSTVIYGAVGVIALVGRAVKQVSGKQVSGKRVSLKQVSGKQGRRA